MENKKEIVKSLEEMIKGSAQARKWYLKTDLKVRLKLLVEDDDQGFDEFISLWKRINIIKKDFPDSYQEIIDKAVHETVQELENYDNWAKRANLKLEKLLDLKDEDVRILYRRSIMIYFTADNHFFHGNIIGSCNRLFNDVNEMNKEMIKKWNNIVTNNDDIYILGDFAYKAKIQDVNEILSRLKGRKYLIKGNHEHYLSDSNFNKDAFVWVKDYYVLNYKGTDFILFHYPILEWHKYYRGSIHLYGHVHNSIERNEEFAKKIESLGQNAINVGVDVNYFCPISILRILEQVKENKESEEEE